MRRWTCLLVLCAAATAAAEPTGSFLVRVVDGSGAPLPDVVVTVVDASNRMQSGRTDARGERRFHLPPGPHAVVATFGAIASPKATIDVLPGEETSWTFRFQARAEEIRIREPWDSGAVPPVVVRETAPRELPYSDEAIAQNTYSVVWLLLTIDAEGAVQRAEVLKSPAGMGLDTIAVAEARKLRFRPALDRDGRATAAKLVWVMEWSPYWATRETPYGRTIAFCAGSGPLKLDYLGTKAGVTVAYKDCSPPKGYEHIGRLPTSSGQSPARKTWRAPK